MKYAGTISAVAGLIVIGTGLWVVGSPFRAREVRFDATRIKQLQIISNQLSDYWQAKATLPETLSQLNDPLRGVTVPVDPKTRMSYEYSHTSDTEFTVCATFNQEGLADEIIGPDMAYYPYGVDDPVQAANWSHPAGRHCFTRSIDKDFFRKDVKNID